MFKCWVEDAVDATIVHVQGDVDLITAPEFRESVHTTVRNNTHIGPVVVDLTEIEYLDATGFLTLEEGRQLCRQHNRELMLVAPPPHVERMLGLLDLTAVLPIFDSVEALSERAPLNRAGSTSGREDDVMAPPVAKPGWAAGPS